MTPSSTANSSPALGAASDFYALGPRMLSRSRAAKARWAAVSVSFQAFDVLRLDGRDLCRDPWSQRRNLLDALQFVGG